MTEEILEKKDKRRPDRRKRTVEVRTQVKEIQELYRGKFRDEGDREMETDRKKIRSGGQ